jgi:GGDEF domain-containing protein/tetratricopeptide (TPR) repeat protein
MSETAKRLEKASKYLQKGNLELALAEYLRVLDDEPGHEPAALSAAELQVQLGRRSEAQAVLTGLLERQLAGGSPGAAQTWKKLCRFARPAPELAVRLALAFQKNDPKLALEAARMAAPALLHTGRKKEALAAYELLASLEINNRDHLRRMAELTAEIGDRPTAAMHYFRLGTMDPESRDVLENLRRAHELDPRNAEITVSFAKASMATKRDVDILAGVDALEPIITSEACGDEVRQMYGEALLGMGRIAKAAPFILEAFEKTGRGSEAIAGILRNLLSTGQDTAAIEIAGRFERACFNAGRRRDCIQLLRQLAEMRPPRMAFLEHLAEVFNTSSYEQDYSRTLLQLYELYFAAGNFLKAANYLELAAEVDAYEPGHNRRLEVLRGKIPTKLFNAIGSRFGLVEAPEDPTIAAVQEESTVLEDLVLQAEFFLQYKLPGRAAERLDRIRRLFPGEETNNVRLRELYLQAGIAPLMPSVAASTSTNDAPQRVGFAPPMRTSAAEIPSPMMTATPMSGFSAQQTMAPQPPAPTPAQAQVPDLKNLNRVGEIARNIQRQGTVKAVLFTGVNDIGRHWHAGRCIALMATPAKPPSIAMEYCAPGLKQSDIKDIIKLLGILHPLVIVDGPIAVPNPKAPRKHAPLRTFVASLGVESLLAMPLLDGDQHAGLLILADCDSAREWSPADITLLKTLCDQMSLAVTNARLRGLVRDLSITEERSGLLKRASYIDVLIAEVRRSQEQRSTCCVLMLDFMPDYEAARINGESNAEALMQHIGQIVSSHIRQNDVAVRYDTATIALVLADTTEQSGVLAGEKLRRVLASMPLPGSDNAPRAAAAVVEAVMHRGFDPVDVVTELINRAEEALLVARTSCPTAYALPSPWKATQAAVR